MKTSVYDYTVHNVLISFVESPDVKEYANIAIVPSDVDTATLLGDNDIFFYVHSYDEFLKLCKKDNGEDFYICDDI